MKDPIAFRYDPSEQTILIEYNESVTELYSNVSKSDFDLLKDIDEFFKKSSTLFDRLIQIIEAQATQIHSNTFFKNLDSLQQKAIQDYKKCVKFQDQLSTLDSNVAKDLLDLLYKLEKFHKHYFRALTVGQSLSMSHQLISEYLKTESYTYLYSFVRNTCSTMEYLGTLIENRQGDGHLSLDSTHQTARSVYKELREQNLGMMSIKEDEMPLEGTDVIVPPKNRRIKYKDIPIANNSMEYLWEKRCQIVHGSPLIIEQEMTNHLPEEILSSNILTKNDIDKLTELSFRLHLHSTLLFIKHLSTYLKSMIPPMVTVLYPENQKK